MLRSVTARFLLLATLVSAGLSGVSAFEAENYMTKLKEHYKHTLSINAFALNQHFTNKQYRDLNYWDYEEPNVYLSVRSAEVDLARKHFYDNDILYFAGGRLYDRVKFQNDTESFFYERSATTYGKAILKQGMDNYDRSIQYMVLNIDFLAIRPILEEDNIKDKISLHLDKKAGTTTLVHKSSDESIVDYKFSNAPLQLISINHRPLGGVFVYDDYQTTRGIRYARSVNSYYNGSTEPTYIKFNDHFEVIERVEPDRLKLPEGYGPVMDWGDGIFTSQEIAKDLYLVTDSSEITNSLLKVNGNEITVFGGSVGARDAEKIAKLIQDQFPEKKITSVYVTHSHGHQIAGLRVFADLGAEILADEYTIKGIKAYPRFSGDIAKFKFREISHEQIIDGTKFYVLENIHSKRQGFVYFADSGIIFQSHFMHIPRDNTIAKVVPSYTRSFIDFVRRAELKVNRIVGNYRNNNITLDVMNKTYASNR